MKILVIEDHPKIRVNIIEYLSIKWFIAEWANHGEEALYMLHANYDVVLLDMNMPIMDGKVFIEKMRKLGYETPIIVLTSNSLLDDKITMFDLWADDYVIKPFEMRELEARIMALSRRKEKKIEEIILFWDYSIEPWKKTIKKWDTSLEITGKEYGIIEFLARNKWYPKNKTEILEAVWGMKEAELAMDSVTLEAHISSLRKKLGKSVIETLKWVGYTIK